ncbi:MAG: hypothetical protein K0R50_3829 [Eubacterium sp.]|jgi:hypothetical protein|nr:hypothetical protein [Eubacterium sp.]
MNTKINVKPAKKPVPEKASNDWNNRSVFDDDRDILSRAISDISQESLVQGLIYSEIFGRPKCKRSGR